MAIYLCHKRKLLTLLNSNSNLPDRTDLSKHVESIIGNCVIVLLIIDKNPILSLFLVVNHHQFWMNCHLWIRIYIQTINSTCLLRWSKTVTKFVKLRCINSINLENMSAWCELCRIRQNRCLKGINFEHILTVLSPNCNSVILYSDVATINGIGCCFF